LEHLRYGGRERPLSHPLKGDRLLDYAIEPTTALLILVAAWVANRLVRRAIGRMVASMSEDRGLAALRAPTALARTGEIPSLRRVQRAETVGALLKSMASLGIWTLAGLMALGTLGLDLGPLIAGAGIVGSLSVHPRTRSATSSPASSC
jgi:small conductance mechanosensitive channel